MMMAGSISSSYGSWGLNITIECTCPCAHADFRDSGNDSICRSMFTKTCKCQSCLFVRLSLHIFSSVHFHVYGFFHFQWVGYNLWYYTDKHDTGHTTNSRLLSECRIRSVVSVIRHGHDWKDARQQTVICQKAGQFSKCWTRWVLVLHAWQVAPWFPSTDITSRSATERNENSGCPSFSKSRNGFRGRRN